MMTAFKTLEAYGYYLKNEHREDVKKYIKFDEFDESLYLQVKHTKDDDWVTFTPEQAKRELNLKNDRKVQRSHLYKTPTTRSSTTPTTRRSPPTLRTRDNASTYPAGRMNKEDSTPMDTGDELQRKKRNWAPPPRNF